MFYYAEDDRFDDMYEGHEDYVHIDSLPDFDHVKDHLEGVLQAMYVTGNVDALERSLEEVLAQFDMEIPRNEPVITKKKESFSTKLFNLGVHLMEKQRDLATA